MLRCSKLWKTFLIVNYKLYDEIHKKIVLYCEKIYLLCTIILTKTFTVMKKVTINYFTLRIISAILLGVVLLLSKANAPEIFVIIIGVLFIVPGLLAFVNYLFSTREKRPDMVYMFAGLGSLLFGVALVVKPEFFVNILMFIFGIILLIGSIEQFVILFRARKQVKVHAVFYMTPLLLLITGIIVVLNPTQFAEFISKLIGAMCLVYGVMETVYWIKFKRNIAKSEEKIVQS